MPEWQENIQSVINASANKVTARFLQLATVDKDQLPAVRTVVFRGFVEKTNSIIIHTDVRSDKVLQIEKQNAAQLCWYFVEPRLQYRISGKIEILRTTQSTLQNKKLITAQWNTLSPEAKSGYETELPTLTVSSDIASHQPMTKDERNNTTLPPSRNFAILLFHATQVECLNLATTPHTLFATRL